MDLNETVEQKQSNRASTEPRPSVVALANSKHRSPSALKSSLFQQSASQFHSLAERHPATLRRSEESVHLCSAELAHLGYTIPRRISHAIRQTDRRAIGAIPARVLGSNNFTQHFRPTCCNRK